MKQVKIGSRALQQALAAVERLNRTETVVAPRTPSASMLASGSRAGGVDSETAERIYRAMVAVLLEEPLGPTAGDEA